MPSATRTAINAARLMGRLDAFAMIGGGVDGGVDRQAFTLADRQARRTLADIALARGFEVSQDAVANLFIRRSGRNGSLPAFMIGSHLDTQPTGGRYDGALGTLAALEVLETLDDAGIALDMPIELVAWSNEEGCRFAPGSMGSQAFAGILDIEGLLVSTASDGAQLKDELDATLGALVDVPLRPLGSVPAGYLELHIEQGPILEREGIPIGVVGGVQGTRWLSVKVNGEAGHAGTTPLSARRDPMAAAVAALARLYAVIMPGDADARLTVGRISADPGSVNAIPGSVTFTIDIRHPLLPRLAAIEDEIVSTLRDAAGTEGCSVQVERLSNMPPMQFSEPLLKTIEAAADGLGVRHRRMVSGAFHDALFIGRIAPAAMIFVPCRNGISHNPNEFVEPAHAALGAELLLQATLRAVNFGGSRSNNGETTGASVSPATHNNATQRRGVGT